MAGSRGPKPLPSNVHLLQGNRSKKPLSQLLDGIRPDVELPNPPDHLDEIAQEEWTRFGSELLKLRVVSAIDQAVLEIYCANYSLWVKACRRLKELDFEKGSIDVTPSGYKQISVYLQIRNRAAEEMRKSAAEFGATPSARTRVSPSAPQGDLFGYDSQPEKKGTGRFFSD